MADKNPTPKKRLQDNNIYTEAENRKESFKKGGTACKKGGKVMSKAARPARASGGSVLSSAASGTPRGKASHY